jgi:UDP-glucose 4-epimerase
VQVLVTGGAGFIGSHVVERLLTREHSVSVIDDLSAGRRSNLPGGVALVPASIFDPVLPELCQGADVVIHAAAQTSVAASTSDPRADARTNIIGTLTVLSAAARAGVRRFIYLSSAAVYGQPVRLPVTEAHRLAPTSPYGVSKLTGEYYVRLQGLQGMQCTVLRLANVYGPRQSAAGEAGVIARWAAALAGGEPIILHGDGRQTRDFIYVEDVAAAVAAAAESALSGTFNIGTGRETALIDLLAGMECVSGQPAARVMQPHRQGDIARSVLKSARANRLLGWNAETSLHEGLVRTFTWAGAQAAGRSAS